MYSHIAQIGLPEQSNRKDALVSEWQIDCFSPLPADNAADNTYPLSELKQRHACAPYDAVCVALPHCPETPERALAPEDCALLAAAIAFAEEAGLPLCFRIPSAESPRALCEQIEQLSSSVDLLQQDADAYQIISNSFFWRLTKPLRMLSEACKRLARRLPTLGKFIKGMRYLLRHGPAATLRKMKRRGGEIGLAKKPLYTPEELEAQRARTFDREIKFSILVPLYNTPLPFLREMIASVTSQTYSNWELCLADGSDDAHAEVALETARLAASEPRIVYRKLEKNLGISENTNACIDMASGDFIALFDHDDILHPAALYNMMEAITEQGADMVYTDEAIFQSPKLKNIIRANYKPDYAPDTLRALNYICHFTCFDRALLDRAGRFRSEFDGSQDHDLMLRLTEQAARVVHIPKVLYYWRAHKQSVAMDAGAKSYAAENGKRAVLAAMERTGQFGRVESSRALSSMYRIHYDIPVKERVSIIIPNKNHSNDLRLCIDSILTRTTYPDYEIVIVDNGSTEQALHAYYEELKKDSRFKICSLDIPFNYSKLNNFAAEHATGAYYLLLNNDIEILTPNWIEEMVMYAQRPDVGAVGAMLYYPDKTIQHAGVILGIGGIAGHAFKYFPRDELGYMGRLCYAQNLSAVTAACMLVKADLYREVGGLDEGFKVAFNDIDFCMKLRAAGYLIVWTPHAEAIHYESKSRGYEDSDEKKKRFNSEAARFRRKWGDVLSAGDPYYNKNLTLEHEDFSMGE